MDGTKIRAQNYKKNNYCKQLSSSKHYSNITNNQFYPIYLLNDKSNVTEQ